jgi:hypothetical protein
MGTPWRKHANDHTIGMLQMISFFVIARLCSSINVNPTPGTSTTMGITMRVTTVKDKPTGKAITTTAATSKERRSKRLAKSPRTVNVNSLISEINLPTTQFDDVLEALRLMMMQDSPQDKGLNAPCNLAPPAEKADQIASFASPTGIKQHLIVINGTTMNTGTEASPQARVSISKTTTTVEAEPTSTASTSTSRRLILQSESKSTTQESNPSISDDEASQSRSHLKQVHDRTNMLFCVFSDNLTMASKK